LFKAQLRQVFHQAISHPPYYLLGHLQELVFFFDKIFRAENREHTCPMPPDAREDFHLADSVSHIFDLDL
jgi:hypothetical protein